MRKILLIWGVLMLLVSVETMAQYDSLSPMPERNSMDPQQSQMMAAPEATIAPANADLMGGQAPEQQPTARRGPLTDSSANNASQNSLTEPPPFDGDVNDSGVPIDGGLSLLLATGLGIGGRSLARRKKQKENARHSE